MFQIPKKFDYYKDFLNNVTGLSNFTPATQSILSKSSISLKKDSVACVFSWILLYFQKSCSVEDLYMYLFFI